MLAVIGASPRATEACTGIAAELAASGKRVVIVEVDGLLRSDSLPGATGCLPGSIPNVWVWPPASDGAVEFYPRPAQPAGEADWLGALRRVFDAVLLNCPAPRALGASEIAALAEAAVLVVEAGQTTRQQVQRDRRLLETAGIKLSGCILMLRR